MEVFNLTVNQMLVVFVFMLAGYYLKKKNIVADNAHANLSRMELFVLNPALCLNNMITKCTVENFKNNVVLMLYGLIVILSVVLISYPVSKLFIRNYNESREMTYKRNIYKYAFAFSNYGFVGNFIVLGIWGNEMLFKYSMFTFGLTIVCYTWGLFILIPRDRNKKAIKNIVKGITSPPLLANLAGMILGLLGAADYMPQFVGTVLSNATDCVGPIAMLLAGMVIGNYDLKKLFFNKKVYVMSLLRLVVIPAAIIIAMKLLKIDDTIATLAMIAFASPLGLNTIVYPAAYGGETETGASMTLISSLASVITIPLMYLIFIVWL